MKQIAWMSKYEKDPFSQYQGAVVLECPKDPQNWTVIELPGLYTANQGNFPIRADLSDRSRDMKIKSVILTDDRVSYEVTFTDDTTMLVRSGSIYMHGPDHRGVQRLELEFFKIDQEVKPKNIKVDTVIAPNGDSFNKYPYAPIIGFDPGFEKKIDCTCSWEQVYKDGCQCGGK